jgi:hypothetical protein
MMMTTPKIMMEANKERKVSGKYFNKGMKALDASHIGHVVKEKQMIR